ncbi:MAG: hypothetical protein SFU98_14240 [Leptospiraceae bacterium]|nr:hypothetical protein [Leptospiraceae bacterium]
MNKILLLLTILLSTTFVFAKDKSGTKTIKAKYEDATVYTGYTLYVFKDVASGEKVEIQQVSGETKVKAPKNLLEDPKEIEGLPGANPKMVGKTFTIKYLKNDRIVISK